jgi:radical SAM protein with 4Fe4S-binding SPASM domain
VKALRAARDKQRTDCVLGVGFVVSPYNWREVGEAARLARELGADNLRISAMFSSEDERAFAGCHAEAAAACKAAEGESRAGFTVINRFGDRLDDLKAKRPDDRLCGYQFMTTYIGANMQVYRCCQYAYNDLGHVGSLEGRRFRDLWMSRERFERQWSFDGRQCERCQFRRINGLLAYALDPQPQVHEEFV